MKLSLFSSIALDIDEGEPGTDHQRQSAVERQLGLRARRPRGKRGLGRGGGPGCGDERQGGGGGGLSRVKRRLVRPL